MYIFQKDRHSVINGLISANSVYIGCKEKTIFILVEVATPNDVIPTLSKGKISMINYLFYQDKDFILILTMDSNEKKNTS